MDIGKRIKELRKERNLTQKQFGQLVHKSSQVVSNWERGYTTGITAEDLQAIAHAFGIPEGEILNDGTSAAPAPAEPPTGLTARDERDIERRLDAIMNDLAPGTGLAFYDGKELTEKERDLLRISLKNSMELVRSMAKERFTPKKYKK